MQLSKSDLVVARVLLVCLALAAIPVLLKGFMATMFVLWVMCVVLCGMFQGAIWKGYGTKGLFISYFVHHGTKNGLTATEVYTRGRNVTSVMVFIIPLLYFTAR
ncbi:MAG: hypothetical protein K9L31_00155 [Candidatus Pacebacteria bacterium]|nr:hypothetical protein [Candidatus Paceibacterota bacterium]